MPGTLFVVATPIGNLEDFTFRALRTLREVDLIAAEDTRRTSKLLAHYEVRKPLVSLHEHNEVREAPRLVNRLAGGESVALVTDAGTPGISDPGAVLVRMAREAGIRVVPIPGPSAVATALSASGFAGTEFAFMGFPPRSGRERAAWFERAAQDARILVFFEAPHRIDRTLAETKTILVDRQIITARELTKIHEELVVHPNQSLGHKPVEAGEYVVMVGPAGNSNDEAIDETAVADLFYRLTELAAISVDSSTSLVAHAFSITESAVRKAVKRDRIAKNRARESDS